MKSFLLNIRVGFFLAIRQVMRSSIWTNVLIIFVMTLTFLNLVVISGILVGIPVGAIDSYRLNYSGEILISKLVSEDYIQKAAEVKNIIDTIDGIESYSSRYISGGTIEANYKEKRNFTEPADEVGANFLGVSPSDENRVTHLEDSLIEGNYLDEGVEGEVLIGSGLLAQYSKIDTLFSTLENVSVGTKVRIKVGGNMKEMTVRGVVDSKVAEIGANVYMNDLELRKLLGRNAYQVNEIAIRLPSIDYAENVKQDLIDSGVEKLAVVETSSEAQSSYIKDIVGTFEILGNIVGGIGLIVGVITIFIVIFINAVSRKKFIGIMKGIGIKAAAIEFSYVFQGLFYSICGVMIGLGLLVGFLKPYFDQHPIDFPFSDGYLFVDVNATVIKILLLLLATFISAYLPSRMIIKKNTLNSILGR